MGSRRRPAVDRFAEKVALTESGCIEWIASLNNRGYGTFASGHGSTVVAHRWSYEYHVGPIPSGFQLDHLCENRACINPDHLDPVTARANLLRAAGMAAINASKTHCPAGHAYSGDNLYIVPKNGDRRCRTCAPMHAAARRANNRKAA